MLAAVNDVMTTAVDAWLWPFRSFPPVVQFCALALPVTALALVVYRYASDQAGIRRTKDMLKAYLLEVRLFRDDLPVTLRAQGQILKYSVLYARYALLPLAIMIVPIALILIQVESRYAFRPLEPDESTIVAVTLNSPRSVTELNAALIPSAGVRCETPPLRLEDEQRILWRVRAEARGEHELRVRIGDELFAKKIVVGESGALSPAIHEADDIRTLAYPLEAPLPGDSLVSSIELTYPYSRGVFAGLSSASWTLFLASLVLGYAFRGLFGVTF